MKKFVFGVLLVFCSAVGAKVTEPMRQEYINSFATNCFKTQRAMSANNTVNSTTIRKYCNCAALYYADVMNNDLLISISRGEQTFPPDLPALAEEYCQKNLFKY